MSPVKSISIAMATHFGEEFLLRQLKSISDQTVNPFELVVCDDCSTDKTRNILEEFSRKASFPVHLHFNETKLGYIDNFFKAISLCKGDLIALSDQDDVWNDNKLEISLKAINEEDAWLHAHSVTLIDKSGSCIGSLRPLKASGQASYRTLSAWSTFSGFTCTFRKELIELFPKETRPIDLIHGDKLMAHDRWITHLGLLKGRVVYSDTPLAAYRQHSKNLFGARKWNTINKIKKFRKEYINYLNKRSLIAQKMYVVSQNIKNINKSDAKYNDHMWSVMAKSYSERRDIFVEHKYLLKRVCAIFKKFYHDYDIKSFFKDSLAAVVLAF